MCISAVFLDGLTVGIGNDGLKGKKPFQTICLEQRLVQRFLEMNIFKSRLCLLDSRWKGWDAGSMMDTSQAVQLDSSIKLL